MKPTFLKGIVLGALTGAVFAAATVALASTLPFTLGTTNRVNAPSTVTNVNANGTQNAIPNPLITLENKTTGAGATALALTVDPAKPPFTTNSATKVANLNADKIDGIDSAAFERGTGQVLKRVVSLSAGAAETPLIDQSTGKPPFKVTYTCPASPENTDGTVTFYNRSATQDLTLWEEAISQREPGASRVDTIGHGISRAYPTLWAGQLVSLRIGWNDGRTLTLWVVSDHRFDSAGQRCQVEAMAVTA